MPGIGIGIYPGQGTAGDEISSTYEGRHLTFPESSLACIHALVEKGDPVVVHTAGGDIVGVAFNTAAAPSDLIAIDTEGIWMLTVLAEDDWGDSAIAVGDALYINDVDGICTISKKCDPERNTLFGYALGSVVAGGYGQICVKVHWGPSEDHIAMGVTANGGTRFTEAVTARPRVEINSDYSGITGYHVPVFVSGALTSTGEGTIYAIRGHTAIGAGVTANSAAGQYLVGVHGRFANQGITDGNNIMIAGVLGQLLAGGTYTQVSRMFAIWGDSQLDKVVSAGETAMLGLTNNGAHNFGSAIYIYGNLHMLHLFTIDTCTQANGFVSPTAEIGGNSIKMKIDVDGIDYYVNAYTG